MLRKIVQINEEKCNGCGACANACHEGAIAMVDGKARLIKDDYCDGLGDCLPTCPTDAISIIEREAADYDEEAVAERMGREVTIQRDVHMHQGCPGTMARAIDHGSAAARAQKSETSAASELQQWPVQIQLLPVKAPFYENAKLLIAADCTAYAYANFHHDFIKDHVVLVGCPKLDPVEYSEKLTEILKNNNIKSVKVVRMEVPCCGGLEYAAKTALQNSGKFLPWQVITVGINGEIVEEN